MTKEKALAACYGCMCGVDKEDLDEFLSSLCVHGLPHAYLLTLLLSEALAEHILLEFSSKVTSADVETHKWKASYRKSMVASVFTLEVASGDTTIV